MNKRLKNSHFGKIVNYINKNYEPGEIIKRPDLIKNVKLPNSTVDCYRSRLCMIGLVEEHKRGQYKLIHKIPDTLNTAILWKLLNTRWQWQAWFIPPLERIQYEYDKKYGGGGENW